MNNSHLETIVGYENASVEQKIGCLKLLKVVVKNLADSQKCIELKYRQLKTSNEKVATLLGFPPAVGFLMSIGFSHEKDLDSNDGSTVFQIPSEHAVNPAAMQTALLQVTAAIAKAAPSSLSSSSSTHVNQKPVVVKDRLSEKQKARLLLAKKEAEEKKLDRLYREKNLQALKQDAHVRRNDANWKSGVSSAIAKTGSTIETFRDKYGEN